MSTPSSPATIDLERLLAPIPGDNPSGASLAYSPEYDQIREARRADDALDQGQWARERKVADYDIVVDRATACLESKTKDLQIAAWLAEALGRFHGFAGLRDGLALLGGIQERFWETYYPEIDDGDVESRFGPFLFLNDKLKGLPFLIRSIPITQGLDDQEFAFLKHAESREVDNLIAKDPAKEKQVLAGGKITGKQFDDAVSQTPKGFYARLSSALSESRATLKQFEDSTDERFGRDAPSLLEVGKALDEVARVVEPILAAKRLAEPDPVEVPDAPPPAAEGETPSEAEPSAAAPASDGVVAFDGVVVPKRRARLGTPQEGETLDFGRVLIDYQARVQALAEAGAKLSENRQKYAALLAEMKGLDDEYEELSQVISRDREAYQLLARLLKRS